MIKEPKAMEEIHQIMEKVAGEERGLARKEILKRIHNSSEGLIKKHNLKLRKTKKVIAPAA